MKVLFALSGLHRCARGAEIAFSAIAEELSKAGDSTTLIGSGRPHSREPYRFLHAASLSREKFEGFPKLPSLRDDCAYEDLTFLPALVQRYRPSDYDVTLTCSYPFTNWVLRRPTLRGKRPPHVFVTQNGDWAAYASNSEYRFFGCDGLVCTNPDFFERNQTRWRSRLIPNGIDCERFRLGEARRHEFDLPPDRLIVLMVSALIPSKRVEIGIEVISHIPDAHLVIAGDGPLRQIIDALAMKLLPGRFTRLSLAPEKMPILYQSADVFLHLSREESFGNVFLEAMACGLPIVAQDSSRLRWIVGDGEFLFDDAEPEVIAQSIKRARGARESRKEARFARASEFAWPKIARRYQEFLREIVENA
jgi:glycosyltransferase involved in cell wall biosynthesis